jgi:hypothetical protein
MSMVRFVMGQKVMGGHLQDTARETGPPVATRWYMSCLYKFQILYPRYNETNVKINLIEYREHTECTFKYRRVPSDGLLTTFTTTTTATVYSKLVWYR